MANKGDEKHEEVVLETLRTGEQPPEDTRINFGDEDQIARAKDTEAARTAEEAARVPKEGE